MNARFRLKWFVPLGLILLFVFFVDRWRRVPDESRHDRDILTAARKHGVEPALVKAVVWKESRFDAQARGKSGELGLMQIMPATAADWSGARGTGIYSDDMLLDAAQNIDCGAWYLSRLLARYRHTDDPVPHALADYNAGRGNVLKWITASTMTNGSAATNSGEFIEQIGFPSTQQYVRDVVKRREKYRGEFSGP